MQLLFKGALQMSRFTLLLLTRHTILTAISKTNTDYLVVV